MKNLNLKFILPIVTAVLIFITLTFGYFTPLLKGKVIVQSDMQQHRGMSQEGNDYWDRNHKDALWTNSMFGGMPAYQVSMHNPNLVKNIYTVFTLWFPTPANILFTYLLGFFILMLVLKVDHWLAIIGAMAFAFSAYFLIIIGAGHITKALAIGYMAPVFAGAILICRRQYLQGGIFMTLFMTLEIYCNHYQITYYLLILLIIYVGIEYIDLIRKKLYKDILKGLGVFAIAAIISFGCNFSTIRNVYDYAKHTIRGPSELTNDKGNLTSGLDKDYAVQWSLGKAETMTLMIPGFKGHSSSIQVKENKNALNNVDPQMRESIGSTAQYWGDQPFTISPYSGAIVVFLFIFGLFVVEGYLKWALLITTILSIMLAWGKNFMPLSDFFLDYVPAYNKFRAVSTILVLAEFAIPILAFLALDKLLKKPDFFNAKIKLAFIKKEITVKTAFFISFGLTGGISLLFYLMPDLTVFFAEGEYDRIYNQFSKSNGESIAQQFIDNIEIARKTLFKADALRSFFFITVAAGLIWLYIKSKINKGVLIGIIGILILSDLWMVDKKYLNNDDFKTSKETKLPFPKTVADQAILEDKDPDFRVLNIAVSTFNDASTSYYHKSIGGYHPAKLRRYQDLIDHHISNNIQNIISVFNSSPTDSALRATFQQQGALNMLNTRYIIYSPEAPPIQNRYALGNAWFVNNVKFVKNADEEIKAVGEINPATTVVIDERYKNELDGFTPKADPSASIKLTAYEPNDLKYTSSSTSEQLVVFSEIYYKDGWNAYIDGELKPHFPGDYVLRVMRIPAGKHTIEFKFEPTSFYTGETISLVFCLLLFVLLGIALFMVIKKKAVE